MKNKNIVIALSLVGCLLCGTFGFIKGRATAPIKTVVITKIVHDGGPIEQEVSYTTNTVVGTVPSEATVDAYRWVNVQNPEGIESANNFFEFGAQGVISRGGQIKIMAEQNDDYLVKYTGAPGEGRGGGTLLPTGTIFFMPKKDFAGMTDRFKTGEEKARAAKAQVMALIRN